MKKNQKTLKFVIVQNKSYGSELQGTKIYYEGASLPKGLSEDGRISFGKNILEIFLTKFKKFQWILSKNKDSIIKEYGIYKIRTSIKTLRKLNSEKFSRDRDLKIDIIKHQFTITYPTFFNNLSTGVYLPGTLYRTLSNISVSKLSSEDRDALNRFLPQFISSESASAINLLKATTQIKTLKQLTSELEQYLDESKSESFWQTYIQKNILIIQQGYIKSIEKMNIAIGNTKYPDFCLVTHDNYLDILEIKKPDTNLLKEDTSRSNYYWDTEISKSIIQIENYIEYVIKSSDQIRNYIKDNYKIDLKAIRPRGIILAGISKNIAAQKGKDDFRLLCQSTKNITFVTYDELLNRLKNYISVLENFSKKNKSKM